MLLSFSLLSIHVLCYYNKSYRYVVARVPNERTALLTKARCSRATASQE